MTVMTDILKVFEYNQHFVAMINIIPWNKGIHQK